MDMGTPTAPSATATASSSGGMAMGGMNMGNSMSSASACQVSMLWNWYTVDACFISASWHITSPGMFAGSCIGVIMLVMALSFLRRFHRAVDAQIARSSRLRTISAIPRGAVLKDTESESAGSGQGSPPTRMEIRRPTMVQQGIRALLHMTQFAVAYFIMLLVMYFNGYIIICVLIGSFLGYFVFEWEPIGQ